MAPWLKYVFPEDVTLDIMGFLKRRSPAVHRHDQIVKAMFINKAHYESVRGWFGKIFDRKNGFWINF